MSVKLKQTIEDNLQMISQSIKNMQELPYDLDANIAFRSLDNIHSAVLEYLNKEDSKVKAYVVLKDLQAAQQNDNLINNLSSY